MNDGVVFAVANLDMTSGRSPTAEREMAGRLRRLHGRPDPRSYAVLPRFPKTARTHAWMRATDGWSGRAARGRACKQSSTSCAARATRRRSRSNRSSTC